MRLILLKIQMSISRLYSLQHSLLGSLKSHLDFLVNNERYKWNCRHWDSINAWKCKLAWKISEEKITDSMKDDIKNSVHAGIPAQNYEVDILPRYKEALSLGLSSYKHHLQKRKITASTGSVCKEIEDGEAYSLTHIGGEPT